MDKVTQVDRVFDNGDGSFLVEGTIYRFELSMEEDRYPQYLQPKSTWQPAMESEWVGNMTATLKQSKEGEHLVIESYKVTYFTPEYNDVVSKVEEDELISNRRLNT